MQKEQGFTLLELLVAVTASFLVMAASISLYRQFLDSEQRLDQFRQFAYQNIQIQNMINHLVLEQKGPVYGSEHQVAFLSDFSLLGFGQEAIILKTAVSNKNEKFTLRVYPVATAQTDKVELLKKALDNSLDSSVYYYSQDFSELTPSFSYVFGGDIKNEISGQEPENIIISWSQR